MIPSRRMEYSRAEADSSARPRRGRVRRLLESIAAVTRVAPLASIQPHNQVIVLPITSAAVGFSNRSPVKSD